MALAVDMMNVDSAPSAARRRRERRLRQFLRHERLTVAMVLSEKKHHTSRGQNKDRTTGEENKMNYTAKLRKTPPPAAAATVYDPMVLDEGGALAVGGLPAPLSESSTSRRGDALPLPSGWRRAETAYGRVYYWHVHTRQTQFTPPASDDEDEDEEDEDLDELDDTQSRFPRWVPAHADVPVVPLRELPAGVGVYVRSLGERAAPPSSWTRAVTFLRPLVSGSHLLYSVLA